MEDNGFISTMIVSNNPIIALQSQYTSALSPSSHTLNTTNFPLDTWTYLPPGHAEAQPESLPCLIFFHGTGPQSGTANSLLTQDSPTPTSQINTDNYPHNIVTLSPFKPTGDWDISSIAAQVQTVLDNREFLKIDPTLIFLTGLSLGGIGISGYVFQQSATAADYVPIRGIFPMSGGASGVGATQAQDAINKNIIIRGWLGENDPNGFATVMNTNASETNAISPGYYELNIVAGAGHTSAAWGVPYADNSAGSIYQTVLNTTSTNSIPTDVIERYVLRRYRHNEVFQQDGTTPAAVNDAVYEFADIGRFPDANLVWPGGLTPPIRDVNGYIEIGSANNIEWERFQNAPIPQPSTLWFVMDDVAGENFDVYLNNQGAIIQGNGANLRVNAGTNATFTGGRPADGVTTILQIDLNGANSRLFINNVENASSPQNPGSNPVNLIRIGTSGGGANWRFREMFFTPLLDSSISTQIYNALDAIYP